MQAALPSGATAMITATGIAGAYTSLTTVSGDGQNRSRGLDDGTVVVKAADANGNGVAGQTVTWVYTGDGTVVNGYEHHRRERNGRDARLSPQSSSAGPFTVVASSGTAMRDIQRGQPVRPEGQGSRVKGTTIGQRRGEQQDMLASAVHP